MIQYYLLQNEARELRELLNLPDGQNERSLQSWLVAHPHVLAYVPGLGEFSVVRMEINLQRKSMDIVVSFFGNASFDVFELKRPDVDLTRESRNGGELDKAIEQIVEYDDILAAFDGVVLGKMKVQRLAPPRLFVIIGRSHTAEGDEIDIDHIEQLARERHASKLATADRLHVLTWDTILNAIDSRVEAVRRFARDDSARAQGFRARHYAARATIRRLVQDMIAGASRVDAALLLQRVTNPVTGGLAVPRLYEPEYGDEIRALAIKYAELILALAGRGPLTHSQYKGAVELASTVLYESDGDLSYAFWEHAGTYDAVDLLKEIPDRASSSERARELIESIAQGLIRAMARDKSNACIGAASHIARTFRMHTPLCVAPERMLELMGSDASVEAWSFMSTTLSSIASGRSNQYSWYLQSTHVAYLRAMMGDEIAADLLNSCAASSEAVAAATVFNTAHAYRDPMRLQDGLLAKANSPLPYLKCLVPWHKAISASFSPVASRILTTRTET